MRILCVGDKVDSGLHGPDLEAKASGVDAIVSNGDLPFEYLEYLVTFLGAPLFYVRGNHDPPEGVDKYPGGCTPLDGRIESFSGLRFAGLSGCMWYSGGNNQYTERQMRSRILRLSLGLEVGKFLKSKSPLIFVSHAPVSGVGDGIDLCHRGFKSFLNLASRYEPAFWLHGHVHLYGRGEDDPSWDLQRGRTRFVNSYRYRILDIEGAADDTD